MAHSDAPSPSSHSGMEHFRQQVYYWVKQIPRGKVTSYGQIAKLAGFPRHARHVSKALGQASRAAQLPWFRVIGANGKIAFDADSDHYAKQQRLLEAEGVSFIEGKVSPDCIWQPTTNRNKLTAEEFFK